MFYEKTVLNTCSKFIKFVVSVKFINIANIFMAVLSKILVRGYMHIVVTVHKIAMNLEKIIEIFNTENSVILAQIQ